MGTNFYWSDDDVLHKYNVVKHIGKRSAAGTYCYDCGTTLCDLGTDFVHDGHRGRFLKSCPFCGKTYDPNQGATATTVELGFNTFDEIEQHGVGTASSFRWRMMRHLTVLRTVAAETPDRVCIVDEYERGYTASAFLDMVTKCPIWNQTPAEFS